MRKFFTSESVAEGHPDKVCDYIADSILDAIFEKDNMARVACEVCANNNNVNIFGEITTFADINYEEVVRQAIKEVGYIKEEYGFYHKTCNINIDISKQSPDIAMGIDDIGGAGDQGMMFGYATNETPDYMPMPIYLADKLAIRLAEVRKEGIIEYLRPDGKTQVTLEYEDDKPKRVECVIVSAQHDDNVNVEEIRRDIKKNVIDECIPNDMIDDETKIYINPTGRFVIGGPVGDSGLTGRKLVVDTYGGFARHGGGSFSGKDPTKVDRSGAYMTRYIAKNIVANKLADRCEIQISYAIGVPEPVSIFVDTFGTGKVSDAEIIKIIDKNFKMTPNEIIKTLDLRNPIYRKTTNYGHFGKEYLSWEKNIQLDINN